MALSAGEDEDVVIVVVTVLDWSVFNNGGRSTEVSGIDVVHM